MIEAAKATSITREMRSLLLDGRSEISGHQKDGVLVMNERPIPDAAFNDEDSVEMLRVWIASKGLHCSMKVGMYKEQLKIPEEQAWGRILADVARHLANALESGYGADAQSSLRCIQESFNSELGKQSASIKGVFVDRH